MKICLCFHCLCETYEEAPSEGKELFVSIDDMRVMIDELKLRGYEFGSLNDPRPKTVTITFDDGYHNNIRFARLSQEYNIPYLIFVSAYYVDKRLPFPWFSGKGYSSYEAAEVDYYRLHANESGTEANSYMESDYRPFTYQELFELTNTSQMEVGCHGYYHQPLGKGFEIYLQDERDLSMASIKAHLNISPKYFALANGMYTSQVIRELLRSYDRVLTIGGLPFDREDRIVHRISLINPNIGGPLIQQIDRHLHPLRRLKRIFQTSIALRR